METSIEITPNEFKLLSCIFILLLALIGGYLPLKLSKMRRHNDSYDQLSRSSSPSLQASIVNMFTAGIFFSTSLLHFLPDAVNNEQLSNFMAKKIENHDGANDNPGADQEEYPWANLFFVLGFFILMAFEAIAHEFQHTFISHHPTPGDVPSSTTNTRLSTGSDITDDDGDLDTIRYTNLDSDAKEETSQTTSLLPNKNIHDEYDSVETGQSTYVTDGITDDDDSNAIQNEEEGSTPQIMPLVIFMSLSIHSFMAGIGIGSASGCAWDAFFAILMHKSLVAFSMGVDLTNRNVTTRFYVIALSLFSIMTPLGLLFGWFLTSIFTNGDDSVFGGICTALSGGTFLYISVMEIIPHEFKHPTNVVVKLIALVLGITLIAFSSKYV